MLRTVRDAEDGDAIERASELKELGYDRAWRSLMHRTREIAYEEWRRGALAISQKGVDARASEPPPRGPIRLRLLHMTKIEAEDERKDARPSTSSASIRRPKKAPPTIESRAKRKAGAESGAAKKRKQ